MGQKAGDQPGWSLLSRGQGPEWELRVAGLKGSLVRSLDFIPLAVAAIKVFQAVTGSSSVFRKQQFGC